MYKLIPKDRLLNSFPCKDSIILNSANQRDRDNIRRGVNESGRVILFYYFFIRSDPTRLNSDKKNLDPYPTRPDLCKIIKYLLIIFI
jgi:hypothetical protein